MANDGHPVTAELAAATSAASSFPILIQMRAAATLRLLGP
jgi:hypothetical protein